MARSRSKGGPRKAVQTESFYDRQRKATRRRKYTTIRPVVNGRTKYHKVRLRTDDDGVIHEIRGLSASVGIAHAAYSP